MFLSVDDAFKEEGIAVGIAAGKIVDVAIGERLSFGDVIEADGCQGFVDMKSHDFTKA